MANDEDAVLSKDVADVAALKCCVKVDTIEDVVDVEVIFNVDEEDNDDDEDGVDNASVVNAAVVVAPTDVGVVDNVFDNDDGDGVDMAEFTIDDADKLVL